MLLAVTEDRLNEAVSTNDKGTGVQPGPLPLQPRLARYRVGNPKGPAGTEGISAVNRAPGDTEAAGAHVSHGGASSLEADTTRGVSRNKRWNFCP